MSHPGARPGCLPLRCEASLSSPRPCGLLAAGCAAATLCPRSSLLSSRLPGQRRDRGRAHPRARRGKGVELWEQRPPGSGSGLPVVPGQAVNPAARDVARRRARPASPSGSSVAHVFPEAKPANSAARSATFPARGCSETPASPNAAPASLRGSFQWPFPLLCRRYSVHICSGILSEDGTSAVTVLFSVQPSPESLSKCSLYSGCGVHSCNPSTQKAEAEGS
ncbi:PREDICTED: uncharacterized protein LOC102016932 [Chinchilla lanigera]|uniref:uncharacterized protein LOC102016932 n=1 Tax=Chinchilla lanigera TaxID=34839 RepID=UPI000697C066|nr:PREDICTED: uncharacterized protein LOC102016932 [Chinchilla lanigera]